VAEVAETVLGFQPVPQVAWGHDVATARLARELHDTVAGELATMLLDLERFRAAQVGRKGVLAEIAQLQDRVRFVLSDIRNLLYDQRGLSTVEPDFLGSLRRGFLTRFAERTGVRIHVSVARSWPSVLPSETALTLRRIVQESLNNIDRHSGASSVLIRFNVPTNSEKPALTIADDGRGYGADDVEPGFGLLGIEERAVALGGRVTVANRRRGGSVLKVTLPRRSLGL
jgi:two-component system sensor histidine kinase DegS